MPVLVGGALAVFGLSAVVVRANGERATLGAAADTTLLTIPTSGPAPAGSAATTAAPATTDAPATPATPSSTEPAATTAPATTAPATASAPPTTAPPTTAPPTTIPPATTAAPVVEDTTVAPTTATPTTAPADGRIVEISSRVGSCSFGSNCLIAGFKLVGFRNADTFVCIFGDGSRATFHMRATEVKTACSTSRSPDSITIEVDGVRSETVTR